MSLKEYNDLNKQIVRIYTETCLPCMRNPVFEKGDCKPCNTMKDYSVLQERKKQLKGDGS